MMREIKFRFWTGSMMEPWTHAAYWESLGEYLKGIDGYVPLQYTGIKDKNGKEIYEGDILKFYTVDGELMHTGPVKWREDVSIWACPESIGLTTIEPEDAWIKECEFEISGNIYEHPHLLETNPRNIKNK